MEKTVIYLIDGKEVKEHNIVLPYTVKNMKPSGVKNEVDNYKKTLKIVDIEFAVPEINGCIRKTHLDKIKAKVDGGNPEKLKKFLLAYRKVRDDFKKPKFKENDVKNKKEQTELNKIVKLKAVVDTLKISVKHKRLENEKKALEIELETLSSRSNERELGT